KRGAARAVLSTSEQNAARLDFFDEKGKERAAVVADHSGSVFLLFDRKARMRAALGTGRHDGEFTLFDSAGQSRVDLHAPDAGWTSVQLSDAQGRQRAALQVMDLSAEYSLGTYLDLSSRGQDSSRVSVGAGEDTARFGLSKYPSNLYSSVDIDVS